MVLFEFFKTATFYLNIPISKDIFVTILRNSKYDQLLHSTVINALSVSGLTAVPHTQ